MGSPKLHIKMTSPVSQFSARLVKMSRLSPAIGGSHVKSCQPGASSTYQVISVVQPPIIVQEDRGDRGEYCRAEGGGSHSHHSGPASSPLQGVGNAARSEDTQCEHQYNGFYPNIRGFFYTVISVIFLLQRC